VCVPCGFVCGSALIHLARSVCVASEHFFILFYKVIWKSHFQLPASCDLSNQDSTFCIVYKQLELSSFWNISRSINRQKFAYAICSVVLSDFKSAETWPCPRNIPCKQKYNSRQFCYIMIVKTIENWRGLKKGLKKDYWCTNCIRKNDPTAPPPEAIISVIPNPWYGLLIKRSVVRKCSVYETSYLAGTNSWERVQTISPRWINIL